MLRAGIRPRILRCCSASVAGRHLRAPVRACGPLVADRTIA